MNLTIKKNSLDPLYVQRAKIKALKIAITNAFQIFLTIIFPIIIYNTDISYYPIIQSQTS